jgi:hypothetical protein
LHLASTDALLVAICNTGGVQMPERLLRRKAELSMSFLLEMQKMAKQRRIQRQSARTYLNVITSASTGIIVTTVILLVTADAAQRAL